MKKFKKNLSGNSHDEAPISRFDVSMKLGRNASDNEQIDKFLYDEEQRND